MIVYIAMTIISCVLALYAYKYSGDIIKISKIKIDKTTLFLLLAAIPLLLVSGLRWGVGVDHQNYYWVYTNILYGFNTHVEFLYKLLCQIIQFFTKSEDMAPMFFICSLITITCMTIGIKKSSSNVFLSLFLYITMGFFFYSMNSIRHYIALSIYVLAFYFMREKKFFPFLITIITAALFQKIALVAIPLYFFLNINYKKYWYFIFSGLLMLVSIFNRTILDILYKLGFGFYKAIEDANTEISYLNIGIMLVVSILSTIYKKRLLEIDKKNIILINAAYFGLMFFVLCSWIPVYTRIGQYMSILCIFLIPEIIRVEKRLNVRKFYTISLISGFSIFMIIMLLNSRDPLIALIPYKSIFSR